jgi:hypothetical protein
MPDGRSGSFRTTLAQLNAEAGGIDAVVVRPATARDLSRQAAAGDRRSKIWPGLHRLDVAHCA